MIHVRKTHCLVMSLPTLNPRTVSFQMLQVGFAAVLAETDQGSQLSMFWVAVYLLCVMRKQLVPKRSCPDSFRPPSPPPNLRGTHPCTVPLRTKSTYTYSPNLNAVNRNFNSSQFHDKCLLTLHRRWMNNSTVHVSDWAENQAQQVSMEHGQIYVQVRKDHSSTSLLGFLSERL